MSDNYDKVPTAEEIADRIQTRQGFVAVFQLHPQGRQVLVEIGAILHAFEAARTPEDMALQNAFKTILHRIGVWGDSRGDAEEIVRKLLA